MPLSGPSPISIPVLTDVRIEQVRGAGVEEILPQASLQLEAEEMMAGVRTAVRASPGCKSRRLLKGKKPGQA
jgi:hypothetical protein